MIHEKNNLSNSKKILFLNFLQERIMDEVIINKTVAPFTSRAI